MSEYVVLFTRDGKTEAAGPFKSPKRANRAAELLSQAGAAATVAPLTAWTYAAEQFGIERSPEAIRQAQYHKERLLHGEPWRTVDALGAHRRIQALVANGWSLPKLEQQGGLGRWVLADVLRKQRIYRNTFEAICQLYEELWDKRPPADTMQQRQSIARALNTAKRKGWVPPLAWDDDNIDERSARPKGMRRKAA